MAAAKQNNRDTFLTWAASVVPAQRCKWIEENILKIEQFAVSSRLISGSIFSYTDMITLENINIGIYYDRSHISDMLIAEGVKKNDATSIINAFKRFCKLPLGTVFNFGYVEEKGRQINSLCRTKCMISDNRIVLYALYIFAEKCNLDREFHISYLYDEAVERNGVSPVRIFGLYDEEELKSILLGLSSAYPEFINATFTNDLQTITLRDKTSSDVLSLFEER